MPVPILQRQRALAAIGEVRIGGERKGKQVGAKLETFRLTSQQKELVERAAALYGGSVTKWQSPVGESWQVITARADLPIMVVTGYSLSQLYELWEGSSVCSRRCDGEVEMLSDQPCICNAEGEDKCDIITRFMMLLPELGTSLGWRFRSTGEFAASELAGGVQIANELARGRVFVPAILRLTQRRSVGSGTVHRYAVPVLDFDPRVASAMLNNGEVAALPAGYTPLETSGRGVSVTQALDEVNQQELQRGPRSAEPVGDAEFDEGVVVAPVPDEPEPGNATTPVPAPQPVTEQASEPQAARCELCGEPLETGNHGTGRGQCSPSPSNMDYDEEPEPFISDEWPGDDPDVVPTPPEPTTPEFINEKQRRKFHTVRRTHLVMEHRAKEILMEVTGQDSSSKIPVHLFDKVLARLAAEDTGQDQLL